MFKNILLITLVSLHLTNCPLFQTEDKPNNNLGIAALFLASQQRAAQSRANGIYISGRLVGADGTTAIANTTITIVGRGENSTIVKACGWSAGAKSLCTAGSATAATGGFFRDVISNGTTPSTLYGSTATGAPTIAQRDSECGATVVAAYATSAVALTGTDRVVCDGTSLDSGAKAVGILDTLVANNVTVATITTGADGRFTAVKMPDNFATGNTYTVRVAGRKERRLRVAKSGTSTLLNNTCNGANQPVATDCVNGNEAGRIDLILGNSATDPNRGTQALATTEGLGDVPSTSTNAFGFNIVDLQVEVVYSKPFDILTGTLTSNTTLNASRDYLLSGTVIVPSGVTLTIPAGTRIFGAVSPAGALLVKQGGRINAVGTATNPIVFSSEKTSPNRSGGDWQGIIIQGNGIQTFGGAGVTAIGEGDTGTFGGNNNADNSGTMRYVRIEFAGAPFSPGNERNCLSLMGVGSATTLEYIQCHRGFDDGFEIWGGAVNGKYWVATGNRDDQFDFADGWRGTLQFGIAQLYSGPTAANDDTSRCIEGDGNTAQTCASAAECSDPNFANITCIGFGSGQNLGDAIFLRRSNGLKTGTFSHFLIQNFGALRSSNCSAASGNNSAAASVINHTYTNNTGVNNFCTGGLLQIDQAGVTLSSISETTPNFVPSAANQTTGTVNVNTIITGADSATFYGALDFGGTNWTTGWTSYPQN